MLKKRINKLYFKVTSCNPCGYNGGNGPCQNGGMCINSNCQAMCQCSSSSYYGNYCQYQVATTTPCVTTTYVPGKNKINLIC